MKIIYICTRCGKLFTSKVNLNIMESGVGMSVYWCNDCIATHSKTKDLNTAEVIL